MGPPPARAVGGNARHSSEPCAADSMAAGEGGEKGKDLGGPFLRANGGIRRRRGGVRASRAPDFAAAHQGGVCGGAPKAERAVVVSAAAEYSGGPDALCGLVCG